MAILSDTAQEVSNVGKTVSDFFSSIGDIISAGVNIVKSIRYGFTSLVSGVYDLITDVLSGGVFTDVSNVFTQISAYIGGPATMFLASLLILIMLRIFVSFIFKIFRLNIDYHSLQSKSRTIQQHEALKH